MKTKTRTKVALLAAVLAACMLLLGAAGLAPQHRAAAAEAAYALTLEGELTVKAGGAYGENAYYAGTLSQSSGVSGGFYYTNAVSETGDITMRYTASEQTRISTVQYGFARFTGNTAAWPVQCGAMDLLTNGTTNTFSDNFAYRYSVADHAVYDMSAATDGETGTRVARNQFVVADTTYETVDAQNASYFGVYQNGSGMTVTFDKYVCYNAAYDDLGFAYQKTGATSTVSLYGTAGQTVYVALSNGYELTGVAAEGAEGPVKLQNVQKNDDGTVSFTMPGEAVTVSPVFTDTAQALGSGEGITFKTGGAYADGPFFEVDASWSGAGFIFNATPSSGNIYMTYTVTDEARPTYAGARFGSARAYSLQNRYVYLNGVLDYITIDSATTWRNAYNNGAVRALPYDMTLSYSVATHAKTVFTTAGNSNLLTEDDAIKAAQKAGNEGTLNAIFDELYAEDGAYFGTAWNGGSYNITAARFRCYDEQNNDLGVYLGFADEGSSAQRKALPGKSVNFTIAEIEGKQLLSYKVVNGSGEDVSTQVGLTRQSGVYTFTMPGYAVEVVAEYAVIADERAEAVRELNDYVSLSDYRAAQQELVNAAISYGTQAINAANTVENIAEALSAAKANIDEIPTDAELTAEEVAVAKNTAVSKLDGYIVEDNLEKYREAQKAQVKSAVAAGKEAVNEAATVAGVNEALAAAEDAIADIKTDAQLTADEEFATEKEEAKAALNAYLADAFLSVYRSDEQEEVRAAVQAGITGIERAVNTGEIETAASAAAAAIAAIKTDAQLTAEELAAAKAEAKEELAAYADLDDYREAEKQSVNTAVAAGTTAIDEAADVAAVNAALSAAKANIDAIATDEELTAQEAAALAAAKTAAKEELAAYANAEDYRAAQQTVLQTIISSGNSAIDAAADVAAVNAALSAAKANIDEIPTDAELTAEENAAAPDNKNESGCGSALGAGAGSLFAAVAAATVFAFARLRKRAG